MPLTVNQLAQIPLGWDIKNKLYGQTAGLGAGSDPGRLSPWMTGGMGGAAGDDGAETSLGATVDPRALEALQGYNFNWSPTGQGDAGTLTAYDPSGTQVGNWSQSDESLGAGLAKWGALAGAGFGAAGLLGLGPLAGAFGGLGAADMGAGAGLSEVGTAGGAGLEGAGVISGGGGLTAPTLTQGAGIGSGLGMSGVSGAAGNAAGGSFWGNLAKNAIGPALSAGAQIIAGNQAAKAQQNATTQANDLQRYIYDTTRADNMPALNARNSALEQMQALLKNPSSLTSQPGYQFGLNEGTRTLNSGAAARGMTYSGAQGKALQRYGQDYAGTKLNDAYNRLSTLASSGQSGANTVAGAASNYGNNVANNLTAQGDANAARYIVNGNAIGNGINSLTAYGQRQGWWGG